MGTDHTGNLLGALSLVIADRTSDAVAGAAGRSDSAAAALSALLHFLDRPTVDRLRQVLGLTSSGTVRLVDRLEAAGYVERAAGGDRRSTVIVLTPEGRAAAERVTAARGEVLDGALGALSAAEAEVLDELLGKLLVGLIRGPGATRWMCRLCDMAACGHSEGRCPVRNETARRYQAG
jgi:DNA-binding MarR family transcriptional regulator